MASGDLLRNLFRGYARQDEATFRSAAKAIIEEERAKNHRLLADDLEKILVNGSWPIVRGHTPSAGYDIPKDKERGFPLLDISEFAFDWERIILSAKQMDVLKQIVREHHRKDLLASGGLRPTQRILFYGPPGCGKTLAAQVMAGVLSYPLVTVRFDAIISSFLGETAANLRRVFEFIRQGQWVVLFDEFDAIGKDRDNPFEHGELKRVVNSLLQLMDAFRGDSILIAATNHEALLDNAVWRRFEAVVRFPLPSNQDRVLMIRLFLGGFDCSRLDLLTIARRLRGAAGSDIEAVTVEAARRSLLDGRHIILKEDIEPALSLLRERRAAMRAVSHYSRGWARDRGRSIDLSDEGEDDGQKS